jgi:hypothetical protein
VSTFRVIARTVVIVGLRVLLAMSVRKENVSSRVSREPQTARVLVSTCKTTVPTAELVGQLVLLGRFVRKESVRSLA